MARSRNIKPGFYKNEDLAECSVWARLIFPGLWMLADREGRLEDRPKRIKAELLPMDAQEVEPLLVELAGRGFIHRYTADGVAVISIPNFSKHQNPHHREQPSVLPPPPQSPGHRVDDMSTKPEAFTPCHGGQAVLIPDSPLSDSLISDSLSTATPDKSGRLLACPDDVDQQVWADWLTLRKTKKAPVTETVVSGARAEARKAGMTMDAFLRIWCTRGSQGLQADWLRPDELGGRGGSRAPVNDWTALAEADERRSAQTETAHARKMRETVEGLAPGVARKTFARPIPAKRHDCQDLDYREGVNDDGALV